MLLRHLSAPIFFYLLHMFFTGTISIYAPISGVTQVIEQKKRAPENAYAPFPCSCQTTITLLSGSVGFVTKLWRPAPTASLAPALTQQRCFSACTFLNNSYIHTRKMVVEHRGGEMPLKAGDQQHFIHVLGIFLSAFTWLLTLTWQELELSKSFGGGD